MDDWLSDSPSLTSREYKEFWTWYYRAALLWYTRKVWPPLWYLFYTKSLTGFSAKSMPRFSVPEIMQQKSQITKKYQIVRRCRCTRYMQIIVHYLAIACQDHKILLIIVVIIILLIINTIVTFKSRAVTIVSLCAREYGFCSQLWHIKGKQLPQRVWNSPIENLDIWGHWTVAGNHQLMLAPASLDLSWR